MRVPRLRRLFSEIWRLVLEPFWLLATTSFAEDPLVPERCLAVRDFNLDMRIPELPCLVARIVWKDGEVWEVCSVDGVAWYREDDGSEVLDPARNALINFYKVCCEICTNIEEGKREAGQLDRA